MSLNVLAPCQLHEEDDKTLETRSCYVGQDGFNLMILLLQSLEPWDYWHMPPCLNPKLRFPQTQQSHKEDSHLTMGLALL